MFNPLLSMPHRVRAVFGIDRDNVSLRNATGPFMEREMGPEGHKMLRCNSRMEGWWRNTELLSKFEFVIINAKGFVAHGTANLIHAVGIYHSFCNQGTGTCEMTRRGNSHLIRSATRIGVRTATRYAARITGKIKDFINL